MKGNKIKLLSIAAFFLLLVVVALLMRPFGAPANSEMDDYFLANGQLETGSNNIVASVVFDYRGLDTLGEASVLFAAATGVFIAFRGLKKK